MLSAGHFLAGTEHEEAWQIRRLSGQQESHDIDAGGVGQMKVLEHDETRAAGRQAFVDEGNGRCAALSKRGGGILVDA